MNIRKAIIVPLFLVIVFSLTACAKLSSRITPNTDFKQYKTYFVVRHAKDIRMIDEIIRDEMILLGLKATSGTIGQKPPNVDVIVTYEDRWYWDITTYMLSLTIDFRDARSNELLATGMSYRPSLQRRPPQEMAREVLESIMKKTNLPAASLTPVYATVGSTQSRNDIVDRDDRYEKYSSGVVRDTRSGLEWYAGPDNDTDYPNALRWIETLQVDGGGWQMPTTRQLKSLFQRGAGTINMTPLLKTTGRYIWRVEARASGAAWDFRYNAPYTGQSRNEFPYFTRAFAVRSRK